MLSVTDSIQFLQRTPCQGRSGRVSRL